MEPETPVMFDYEKSLWDNIVLSMHHSGKTTKVAIKAANEVINARRATFKEQGEN